MRNTAAAEWILSLVAAPDRTASTIGDLVEEAETRGVCWFWASVLQTAAAYLWREFCVSPVRLARLAAWGFLASWWFSAALGTVASSLLRVQVNLSTTAPSSWAPMIVTVLACTGIPALVGWDVARRSAGRELPSSFGVAALFVAAYALTLCLSAMQARRIGLPLPGMERPFIAFAISCSQGVFAIAGAILFKRRTLARRKPVYSARRLRASSGILHANLTSLVAGRR